MGVQWTEEQKKVIQLRDRNILVSAAAGSGKTAVLVERIIQMLTDADHPMDVDRLLIVTFTEAAAAEMKERIRTAIENALEMRPEDAHLQRQATLIHSAQITTIHSFCLSVIRDHFHVIDIDPGFRIAEEGELKLLKQDVLGELLEACYVNASEEYLELVEKFGGGRNDKKLEEQILKLYEYSRSYPQPEKWLKQCVQSYAIDPVCAEEAEFVKKAVELVRQYLSDALQILEEGMKICEEADGPYMYADMLETDMDMLELVSKSRNFREMYDRITELKWKRLSTKKDETVSPEKKEQVKALREQAKKRIKDIIDICFYEEPEELWADMSDSYAAMRTFTELVQQFADAFAAKKQSRNLIDFNDMEQFALRILTEEREGELVPSVVAREYQDQYLEVMIDEYQDSNLIQEAILNSVSTVSREKNNVFMVGDVKQSIYRFRLSRPELFMEKYDTYSLEDSDRQRIDLHKNFRSRTEVLDSVNFLFRQIMRKELGGIAYDDQAALYPGADFEPMLRPDGTSEQKTELLLLDTSDQELPEEIENGTPYVDGTVRQLEARVVAKRIKELVHCAKVKEKATGQYRKAEYRDIVILTRSIRGWADVLSTVLKEEGIPAYAGSREGYFETYEVSVLLDYLQILDNQRQDLPLAAILTSPFVGLNAQELAEIRSTYPELPLYEAAEQYAGVRRAESVDSEGAQACTIDSKEEMQKTDSKLRERLKSFYDQMEHFRRMIPYTAIHELLWKILDETGYGLYITAMPGGEQRMANVEMLVEKAMAFEGTSYKGLFNFVRYIEQLKKYDVDYGEANISDEQSNTVRIMSIHKSKGLEFPIVFVAGMGKKFNTQDVTGSMIIHPEWGVGIDAIDLERRTKIPTLLKKIIQQEVMLENLGEELRVLYVAMTRAKEKLILTGTLANAQAVLEQCRTEMDRQKRENCAGKENGLPFYRLSGARTYLDWIVPAVVCDQAPVDITALNYWDAAILDAVEEESECVARDILEQWNAAQVYDADVKKHLEEQFGFHYAHEDGGKLKLKFTVSELKKRTYLQEESGELYYEEPDVIPLLPQFLQEEEELTGASRGSAYHKLLELLDFRQEYEENSLRKVIDSLRVEKKLSEDMAECIRVEDVLHFLHCKAGRRMQKAAQQSLLFKEQPFVLGVDAREVYPDTESDETILVQGIIDVFFEEDGELVLLDYKTDKVRTAQELKDKYHSQLDYYAQALEQLLEKPVKEKIIYSFTLKEEIEV